MTKAKGVTCYDCGKRFKHIARKRREEDDNRQWQQVPVCRRCWDGVVLVEGADQADLSCEFCGDPDCARSRAWVREYERGMCERIDRRYPSATVVFLPESEFQQEQNACWQPAGYLICPTSIYAEGPVDADEDTLPPCSNGGQGDDEGDGGACGLQ
jgi:hypothetical protein